MERAYRNAESAAVASEPVAKAKPESAPVLGPKPKPQADVPKVQKVQATVIEPDLDRTRACAPAPAPAVSPQTLKSAPHASARREKPAGKTKAIERHRPGRVRMGLGLIGLGLKTLITGKTK
mgnify:CR=1 FL=1